MSVNPSHFTKSQQLKPKRVAEYRKVWQQIKDNGYDVIPLASGKDTPFKGWPKMANQASDIAGWSGRAAGIRLYGHDVLFIDFDVLRADLVARMVAAVQQRWPAFWEQCLRRHSGSSKLGLLGRVKSDKRYLSTLRYLEPDGGSHKVEVFTGSSKRYVGVHGQHSTGREYGYDGRSILEVKLDELPWFPDEDLWELVGLCDEILKESGLAPALPASGPADNKPVLYDITQKTRFDVHEGPDGIGYEQLVDLSYARENVRVSGSFIDGSHNRTKCHVMHCNIARCVGVFDYEAHVWHCPEGAGPPSAEVIAEVLKNITPAPPEQASDPRPADVAGWDRKVQWLLERFGYCAAQHTVVELHQPSDDCLRKPLAFALEYRPWFITPEGKLGGKKKNLYATSLWEHDARRLTLAGVRMRPDRPFPIYEADGQIYKNTYRKPVHEGEGFLHPFPEFMTHLVPDQTERDWFLNWLAHKQRNPGIPGVAVIMVAANGSDPVFGAGRGMLRDILARLLGVRYVRTIDFELFAGKSSQSDYTDWAASAVLVTVSEAKDDAGSGRWADRRAVYERIKELVDPRPVERLFTSKYGKPFISLAFAGYLIFSNHLDAVQLPAGDRRTTVLRNGERMSADMAVRLQDWMDQPGNIAELARFLERRDLSGFDAYAPMATEAKIVMQELARSEMDEAFAAVRARIGPNGLFTGRQVKNAVLGELDSVISADEVYRWVNRRLRTEATQVQTFRTAHQQFTTRQKILGWRNADLAHVKTKERAQAEVVKTEANLKDKDDKGDAEGAEVIQLG